LEKRERTEKGRPNHPRLGKKETKNSFLKDYSLLLSIRPRRVPSQKEGGKGLGETNKINKGEDGGKVKVSLPLTTQSIRSGVGLDWSIGLHSPVHSGTRRHEKDLDNGRVGLEALKCHLLEWNELQPVDRRSRPDPTGRNPTDFTTTKLKGFLGLKISPNPIYYLLL